MPPQQRTKTRKRRPPRIRTVEDMARALKTIGRSQKEFKKGTVVYPPDAPPYTLSALPLRDYDPDFRPQLTVKEMLERGVFEGKYLNQHVGEFPREWFEGALRRGRLSPERPDPAVNEFGVKSRLSIHEWRANGWLPGNTRKTPHPRHPILSDPTANPDKSGWFQWYARYSLGRRLPELDRVQIQRWRAFTRHVAQVRKNCPRGVSRKQARMCRPVQRQALLQWAYDPYPAPARKKT